MIKCNIPGVHIHLYFYKQKSTLCKGGVKFSGIFCNKRGSSLWLAVKRDKWPSANSNSNSNQEKIDIFMHVAATQFPPVFRYSDHHQNPPQLPPLAPEAPQGLPGHMVAQDQCLPGDHHHDENQDCEVEN